jgi:hypothetical protein
LFWSGQHACCRFTACQALAILNYQRKSPRKKLQEELSLVKKKGSRKLKSGGKKKHSKKKYGKKKYGKKKRKKTVRKDIQRREAIREDNIPLTAAKSYNHKRNTDENTS